MERFLGNEYGFGDYGVTESEKDVIRRERATMSGVEVARRHSITRQRVDQVVKSNPDEAKRARERAAGIEEFTYGETVSEQTVDDTGIVVKFRAKKLRHLEEAALQAAIRAEPPIYNVIARKYGISVHAVERIRRHHSDERPTYGYHSFTAEQQQKLKDAARVATRRRWGSMTAEQRSEVQRTYQAKVSPERRRERGLKAAATRKSRAAAAAA